MTNRRYLSDAAFLTTISADDDDLIDRLASALARPRWPLFLGRKSCQPGHPILLGTTTSAPEAVLTSVPAYRPAPKESVPAGFATDWFDAIATDTDTPGTHALTVYLDGVPSHEAHTITRDTPIAFGTYNRAYRTRPVGIDTVHVPAAGTGVAGWVALRDAVTNLP